MTSSNKVRRYLQHHKSTGGEAHGSQPSATQLLLVDPTSSITGMRKFRGKTQQLATTMAIPQICVDDQDEENIDFDDDDDDDDGAYCHSRRIRSGFRQRIETHGRLAHAVIGEARPAQAHLDTCQSTAQLLVLARFIDDDLRVSPS